jgi:hypothetical protein
MLRLPGLLRGRRRARQQEQEEKVDDEERILRHSVHVYSTVVGIQYIVRKYRINVDSKTRRRVRLNVYLHAVECATFGRRIDRALPGSICYKPKGLVLESGRVWGDGCA